MPNIWASLNVPFIHFLLQFFPNSNSIITAILLIGAIGLVIDRLFGLLQHWVSFGREV
jgi:ABC-type nitrate/sulfonate/bicarbonate transport system permease component